MQGKILTYDIKNQNASGSPARRTEEKRTARFVCAIAAVVPGWKVKTVRGTMEGYIGYEPAGENGFGYDPIFMCRN